MLGVYGLTYWRRSPAVFITDTGGAPWANALMRSTCCPTCPRRTRSTCCTRCPSYTTFPDYTLLPGPHHALRIVKRVDWEVKPSRWRDAHSCWRVDLQYHDTNWAIWHHFFKFSHTATLFKVCCMPVICGRLLLVWPRSHGVKYHVVSPSGTISDDSNNIVQEPKCQVFPFPNQKITLQPRGRLGLDSNTRKCLPNSRMLQKPLPARQPAAPVSREGGPRKNQKRFTKVHLNPKEKSELDQQIFVVGRHTSASVMIQVESVFENTGTGIRKNHYSDDNSYFWTVTLMIQFLFPAYNTPLH